MIRRDHRIELEQSERRREAAHVEAATLLTDAVQALLVRCSAAVAAVDYGAEWRLLAQCGPIDVSSSWRQLVAWHDRDGDPAAPPLDALVTQIPVDGMRAMLLVVPDHGTMLPPRSEEILRPLLGAGAILFGAAGPAAPDEPVLRLVGDGRRTEASD